MNDPDVPEDGTETPAAPETTPREPGQSNVDEPPVEQDEDAAIRAALRAKGGTLGKSVGATVVSFAVLALTLTMYHTSQDPFVATCMAVFSVLWAVSTARDAWVMVRFWIIPAIHDKRAAAK